MSDSSTVTMKYLAELAGVSPKLVRRYVAVLRSLVADYDLRSAQEGYS
jgi:predicted DNA-binding transcriptional regulator YafY